jgi:hypothetical protein
MRRIRFSWGRVDAIVHVRERDDVGGGGMVGLSCMPLSLCISLVPTRSTTEQPMWSRDEQPYKR